MKVELTIPDNLNEISLGQYQEFVKAQEENTDAFFISQKLVSIFCQIPMSNVMHIPVTEVEYIVDKIGNMFLKQHSFVNQFELGGKKFGFIPNMEDISLGEYIDLEANIGDLSNYHKAMAVMYRPITESAKDTYLIEQYEGTANYSEVMKFAPVSIALGAQVFFWTLKKDLIRALIVYLEKAEKGLTSSAKPHNLVKDGGGINLSISSLKEMYLDLEMSPVQVSLNV
jgi:hypothetical protein